MLPTAIPLKCQLHATHAKLDLLAQILADTTGNPDWKAIEEWLFANSLPAHMECWTTVPHDTIARALHFAKSHPNPIIIRLGWDFWRLARRVLGRDTAHPLYSHIRNRWEKQAFPSTTKREGALPPAQPK